LGHVTYRVVQWTTGKIGTEAVRGIVTHPALCAGLGRDDLITDPRFATVSSGGSITGIPGLGPYRAGKGAMNALTRVIAVEFGKQGIRCNTIIVGRVVSYAGDQGPETSKELMRVGNPADIGYAAVWLVSDEAEWITGSEITADGGVRYNSSEF
jgi:NAD(P)-dependent dehydrogenase (short-subunit alcohol dehydrogenase family)